jgi:hypothetical protein
MAGTNLKPLVRDIRVATDVAVNAQVGSKPALARTARLSHPRRLSLSLRQTGNQPGTRTYLVDDLDADTTAIRAGRSVRPVGVLVRRCLVMIAGRTVPSGRFKAAREFNNSLGCPLPRRSFMNERSQGSPAWCMPAETSSASTRGTEDK